MDFFNNNSDSNIWSERYRLASLDKDDLTRIGLFTGAFALMFVMFHFVGNTTDADAKGRSAIMWMISRWSDSSISMGNGNYSHGWLIFPVAAFIAWLNRNEMIRADKKVNKMGFVVIIAACLAHYIGAKAQQTRLSLLAFILLIWGLPFYFYGWQIAKRIMFPCAFLIFAIPFNFLNDKTFALRLMAANMSTSILNGLGIKTTCDGTQIESTAGGGFRFGVEDPCSGLRSLLAMTALTAVYAYFTQKGTIKKFLLFFSSVPLAIVGNIFRITTIAIVAQAFGQEIAAGLYHDYSGYLVFSIAIGMMVALGALLSLNFRELVKKWKKTLSDL